MTSPDKSKKDLLNKLSQMSKTVSSPCPIGKIHKQLDPETQVALMNALQSPASNSQIHRALIDEGFSISRTTTACIHNTGELFTIYVKICRYILRCMFLCHYICIVFIMV